MSCLTQKLVPQSFRLAMLGFLLAAAGFWTGCHNQSHEPTNLPEDVVVIELTAIDCHGCGTIHNILQDLRRREFPNLKILTLDITGTTERMDALHAAARVNASGFVRRYIMSPGTVGVINRRTGHSMGAIQFGPVAMTRYRQLIEDAARQMPKGA